MSEPSSHSKSPLVLAFLIAGLALFGLAFFVAVKTSSSKDIRNRIAQVSRETGQVFILRAGLTKRDRVDKRDSLYSLDSIETNETGEAMISLESTFQIKVIEDSVVTFEKVRDSKNAHVVAIIKKGDIQVTSFGREGELFIAKNGERISALDYESSSLKAAPIEVKSINTPTAPAALSQLSEDEINAVMTANRSSFFKCYTQLLQKNPQAKGEVSLALTIENSGKLSVFDLTSAQLSQDEFKKCLLEVMSRLSFRPFQGAPVSAVFPIKFE